ncbi:MAG: FtsX-like permease family protein [Candidatus Latescibacterota bacterium]
MRHVVREAFEVVTPVDHGAVLELAGDSTAVPLHSLWPNLVRTNTTGPEGLEGELFYAAGGSHAEFDGHPMQDALVLMEFNTWANWLDAAALGARAILFIAPEETTIFEARQKWNWAPLNVPRFWVEREAGLALKERLGRAGVRARVQARMDWERHQTWNIWGLVPGTDPVLRKEVWAAQAYYDGISVAPAQAPAAESACGIAGLIELAHYLQEHPPARTVAFIATGAHFLGQAGLRQFLNLHARRRPEFRRRMAQRFVPDSLDVELLLAEMGRRKLTTDSLGVYLSPDPVTGRPALDSVDVELLVARLKLMGVLDTPDTIGVHLEPDSLAIDLFLSLDLSSQSDQLGVWHNNYNAAFRRFFAPVGRNLVRHAQQVARDLGRDPGTALANGISPIKGLTWDSFVNRDVVIPDGRVAQQAGQMALSLMTVNDARLVLDTPLDRPERVSFANLQRQCALLERLVHAAACDPEIFGPERVELRKKHDENLKDGLSDIRGALRLLPRKSTTPDIPVPFGVVALQPSFMDQPWRPSIYLADGEGNYRVGGLTPGGVELQAFRLDPATGQILFATDLGDRAQAFGKVGRWVGAVELYCTTVLFPALELEVFNRVHSQFLFTLGHSTGVQVLDQRTNKPQQYGLVQGDYMSSVMVLFGARGDSLRVIEQSVFLLNNEGATDEEGIQGQGYDLSTTGRLIPYSTLEFARNLWRINEVRNQRLRRYAIENPRVLERHQRTGRLIREAEEAIGKQQWDRYARAAREAQGIEYLAYHDVRRTQDDVIAGVVFFVALMVPAAFFTERLLFAAPDIRRQLALFGAILLVIWIILSQVHPAFQLAHPVIVLLALAIAIMAFFVMSLIVSRFNGFMNALRHKSAGTASADISRSGTSYVAFMLGISNMRRRPLRTVLTLATITLLTFTVLSFTSFKPKISFVGFEKDWEPSYPGALLHDVQWWPWEYTVRDYMRTHFAPYGVVVPRTWLTQGLLEEGLVPVQSSDRQADALSLLGLTPEEPLVTGVDRSLVAGSWFEDPRESTIILPREMAAHLGIGPQDVGQAQVSIFGKAWTVRGLFDPRRFEQVHDLNDEPLTPAKQKVAQAFMPGMQQLVANAARYINFDLELGFEHLDARRVPILPYAALEAMDAPVYSMAVRFHEGVQGEKAVQSFLSRTGFRFYVGLPDQDGNLRALAYTSLGVTSMEGLGALLIPMLIAALIVLNTMMGAVYERFREIGVYSSVGLAPLHIAFLFIAESCVYGVLGVTLGYVIGQTMAKLLIVFDLLGSVSLNYSSTAAIASAVLVMLVVLASTIYPARTASRLAVPDVVRRWQLPAPENDTWSFPFPFTVNRNAVDSLCGYLYAHFSAYGHESVGKLYTERTRICVEEDDERGRTYSVQLLVWLAPFDMGVSQYLQFTFMPSEVLGVYTMTLYIERISGPVAFWERLNLGFMLDMRKQFLIWQTLKEDLHRGHAETARRVAVHAPREALQVEAV